MTNKKQIFSVILSVFLSVIVVAAVVQAASTIGNNVSVGGTLTVTGNTTLNGNVTLGNEPGDVLTPTGYFTYVRVGTSTTFGHIGTVGADELGVEGNVEIDGSAWFDGNVTLGNAAGDTITITGTPTFSATTTLATTTINGTTTLAGDVNLGNGSGDMVYVPGQLFTALVWAATSTAYPIDLNSATANTADIRLSNGETISNATDGTIALSAATTTFDGYVELGDAAADWIMANGNLGTGLIWGATTTAYGIDMNAATLSSADLRLGNGALIANGDANTLTITEATVAVSGNETVSGTLAVTGTTTLSDGIVMGNAAGDKVSVIGELDTGLVWAATSTSILLDMEKASSTSAADIRLSSGAKIMTGAGPAGSGAVVDGSLYIATTTGYVWVNLGTTWYLLATSTTATLSE